MKVLLLLTALASTAVAAEPRFELTVLPFDASFTPPANVAGSAVGPSHTFGTSGALELYFSQRIGVRLLGGASWYSALGVRSASVSANGPDVLLPAWWGFGGVVFRFAPRERWLWVTLHVDAGVNESLLALGELPDAVVETARAGVQGAGQLAAAMHVRLEEHTAFRLELRASIFGAPVSAWGCSTAELGALDSATQSGGDFHGVSVARSCRVNEIPQASTLALANTELRDTKFFLGGTLAIAAGFVFR